MLDNAIINLSLPTPDTPVFLSAIYRFFSAEAEDSFDYSTRTGAVVVPEVISPQPVPAPTSLALIAAALVALGLTRRPLVGAYVTFWLERKKLSGS